MRLYSIAAELAGLHSAKAQSTFPAPGSSVKTCLRLTNIYPILSKSTLRSSYRPQVGCPAGESLRLREEKVKETQQEAKKHKEELANDVIQIKGKHMP